MKRSDLWLGDNIKFLVDELKICSRQDLADALGITVQSVGQTIRGETKGLRPLNLVMAARKLGTSVERLVTESFRATYSKTGRYEGIEPAAALSISEPAPTWARAIYKQGQARRLIGDIAELVQAQKLTRDDLNLVARLVGKLAGQNATPDATPPSKRRI